MVLIYLVTRRDNVAYSKYYVICTTWQGFSEGPVVRGFRDSLNAFVLEGGIRGANRGDWPASSTTDIRGRITLNFRQMKSRRAPERLDRLSVGGGTTCLLLNTKYVR